MERAVNCVNNYKQLIGSDETTWHQINLTQCDPQEHQTREESSIFPSRANCYSVLGISVVVFLSCVLLCTEYFIEYFCGCLGNTSCSRLSEPTGPHWEAHNVANFASGWSRHWTRRVPSDESGIVCVRTLFRASIVEVLFHWKTDQAAGEIGRWKNQSPYTEKTFIFRFKIELPLSFI